MMHPRSSSMGRNTSASVTVTVSLLDVEVRARWVSNALSGTEALHLYSVTSSTWK